MPNEELPRFIRDILSSPPKAGEGCHRWLFASARYLHAFRSPEEIAELLRAELHGCGRRIPERELQAAIADSKKVAWVPGSNKQDTIYQSAWPKFRQQKYDLIVCEGIGAYDLWESSPIRYIDDRSYTEDIIDALFPGNPWLCCGMSNTLFDSMRRESWREFRGGLSKQQFIVPSPTLGAFGITKDGKQSAHCLDNTGPRHYLVIEQDRGTQDQQVAIIVHLTKHLPLALVLWSGSKSLHAWYHCKDKPEDELKKFMREAVSIGADDATWSRSQFVRIPDGLRDNGVRQSVFYFNPDNNVH
jgi:hypothetical protein